MPASRQHSPPSRIAVSPPRCLLCRHYPKVLTLNVRALVVPVPNPLFEPALQPLAHPHCEIQVGSHFPTGERAAV